MGKITSFSETEDGRYLIILNGLSRFKIIKEIKNEKPYRECEISFNDFQNDIKINKEEIKFSDLKLIFKDLKNLFEKRGYSINWDELKKSAVRIEMPICRPRAKPLQEIIENAPGAEPYGVYYSETPNHPESVLHLEPEEAKQYAVDEILKEDLTNQVKEALLLWYKDEEDLYGFNAALNKVTTIPHSNSIKEAWLKTEVAIKSYHVVDRNSSKFSDDKVMKKMAKVVDNQNLKDPSMKGHSPYKPMSDNFDKSTSFKAACELVFHGKTQPSGYTEPILHLNRLLKKN